MPTKKGMILVVGGAGFIGSHMVLMLKENGYTPLVLDNLSNGHAHAVYESELIFGDVRYPKILDEIFANYPIAAVMHFASLIDVGESCQFPLKYYDNNVVGSLNLLTAMKKYKIDKLIFSSSAAVYGEPLALPIDELHTLQPINPYGRSKLMVEQMIADCPSFQYAIFRYFNAAGADPDGRLGENHTPESHLIPNLLKVVRGDTDCFILNGGDYSTNDGTCIRDYIHVNDICRAHLLALQALEENMPSAIFNLGIGHGYSVREVIACVEQITNTRIPIKLAAKREGDPAILVADANKAKQVLHWQPKFIELSTMVTHAWRSMLASDPDLQKLGS